MVVEFSFWIAGSLVLMSMPVGHGSPFHTEGSGLRLEGDSREEVLEFSGRTDMIFQPPDTMDDTDRLP